MKKDKTLYTEDSIISLEPREFTRLRPSTYLGSNEYSTQLVREVFSNALDEFNIGHGSVIRVKINTETNEYKVEDEGQGFPINVVKGDRTVLQAAFDTLNTSGKYDSDGVYSGTSLGVNGIGSKLANFLSKYLEVTSWNNGKFEHIRFEDGIFKTRAVGVTTHKNGTLVCWQPDPQFFQHPEANLTDLKKLFTDMVALCPGLEIILSVDKNEEVFNAPDGLATLLNDKVGNKEILNSRFAIKKESDEGMLDIIMTYTSDYSDSITAYVNYGLTESGVHISILRSLLTYQINKYASDNDLLGKKDDKLTSAELSEGQTIIFNIKAKDVAYDSQVKTKVVDLDSTIIKKVVNGDFVAWLINNPKDAKLIIDRALNARKAKEAAQNAKDRIRNATNKGKKFISLPTKLVDAYSKDRSECEIHICEGDSAGNGFVAKRDGKTQAVFPIRGKILSVRKAPIDKIYANQEISNIVKALGLDINKENGKLIYDSKKLRYNKVIIQTDSDPDGYQIRLLLLNVFWWLCPELVEKGHLYAGVPPLFRVTDKKNNYIYLKDQAALDDYKAKHKSDSYVINRMKGLGEMDPKELAECLLKVSTRNVQQIISDDFKSTDDMLEMAMGDKVETRRKYLLDNY